MSNALLIKTITSVLKVLTHIITTGSITASPGPITLAAILVIMCHIRLTEILVMISASTYKTVAILYESYSMNFQL